MAGSRLAGKRAVVSGAASGIGRATACAFLSEGCTVGLIDRDIAGLNNVLAQLENALRTRARAVQADVRSEAEIGGAISNCIDAFGGLDTIVANAAIEPVDDARAHELELEVWQRTMDINLTGVFLVCKHGIRPLLANGGGSVICTVSPTSLYGVAAHQDAYSASKAGVLGLVKVMMADYARDGIRVNAVLPGFTDTPMNRRVMENPDLRDEIVRTIPLGRPGTAEEVASMMVYLASDEASYVTGATFCVDGGMTAV